MVRALLQRWTPIIVAAGLLVVPAGLAPLPGPGTPPAPLAGASPQEAATTTGVQTGPDDVPRVDGNWSELVFEASGPAGSWVYAYQPLPEPVDGLSVDVSYELSVDGPPGERVVAFAPGPMPTVDEGDGFHVLSWPVDPPIVLGEGGIHRDIHRGFGLGLGNGQVTGVGLGMGADAPWNISVTVTLPDAEGPTTRPSYEHSNASGLVVYDDVERLAPDVYEGANQVSMDGRIEEPGWTTLQILYDVFQPDDVRDMEVHFPDGTHFHRRAIRFGYRLGACGAGSGGGTVLTDPVAPDLYGTYTDVPGRFDATFLHAGGSEDVSLIAVHVPIAAEDLPAGHLRGGFASGWFPCGGTR